MNIQEMHIEFRQSLDRLDSSVYSDILPEQVDYFLNEAILRFVKIRYSRTNTKNTGFEETQKRIEDLTALVQTKFFPLVNYVSESNTYEVDLSRPYDNEGLTVPSTYEYMIYLKGMCKHTKTDCTSKYLVFRIVTHDRLGYELEDPFKKPYKMRSIGYFQNSKLYLITDGTYTITGVNLSYLAYPVIVKQGSVYPTPSTDIDCNLSPETHKEIIQLATLIALENLEISRLKTESEMIQSTVE